MSLKREVMIKDAKENNDAPVSIKFYEEIPQDESEKQKSCLGKVVTKILSLKGYFYSFIAATFFSITNILVIKADLFIATDHLVVLYFNTLIIMLVICCINKENPFGQKDARILLSCRGIVTSFGYFALYFGILFIPPSDCSAINHTSIIVTALLSRIFMKEKLGIPHIIALVLTIVGVVLISKPSLIFQNNSSLNLDMTTNQTLSCKYLNDSCKNIVPVVNVNNDFTFKLGIVLIVISALFCGALQIFIKKLCHHNVHWSVNSIYMAFYGLPLSILASVLLFYFGYSHQNLKEELKVLHIQLFFSGLSALFAISGIVFIIKALTYEDATKISIAKTIDVIISFGLQLIILNITVDFLSVLGSFAIVLSTVIVLGFKLIETKIDDDSNKRTNFFQKLLAIKF